MRQLTAKQKKVLDKWIASQKETREYIESKFTNNRHILGIDDVPMEIYEELERINDTEILHQEVDRYVYDKSVEVLHKR